MDRYARSRELHARAQRVLAGGVSSEFRRYSQPCPLFYASGSGSHVVDIDGNDYLDFTLSQGPLILGHSHPEVLDEVHRASAAGQLFAGQHLQELELAEFLQRTIPCAEMLRFSLSGSEADHAALRVSRAVTGRPKFLRFEGHYHGWFDNVATGIASANADSAGPREQPHNLRWTAGLPDDIEAQSILLPWNDLALVEQTLAKRHLEIAAIITEPVMCNNGCIPPEPGFLEGLRRLCDQYGCVLIFDEVITGFRLGLGGAQKYFGVTPDLGVFGKAMASGYPMSVLAGKQRFMQPIADGKVIHAGTMNSGNPSVAASLATLKVLERDNVHDKLFALGRRLMSGLRAASEQAKQPLLVQGYGPMCHTGFTTVEKVSDFRGTWSYDKAKYGLFVARMQDEGIRLIGRGLWYISAAHTEAEIDEAISTAEKVMRTLS